MTKKKKLTLIICLSIVAAILLTIGIPFIKYGIKSNYIDTEYNYLIEENKITSKVIDNVPLVKQDISCGYAIIEMLSAYYGSMVTEEDLYAKNNNKVSTSSTSGFVKEINRTIENANYVSKEYLKNDEMLLLINESLLKGKPVAVEWAAKLDDVWTLHWSIVTGMDQEHIYINNPYGYTETLTYDEFISRTTFDAFENMNVLYQFGFAFGLFSKNTIIVAE